MPAAWQSSHPKQTSGTKARRRPLFTNVNGCQPEPDQQRGRQSAHRDWQRPGSLPHGAHEPTGFPYMS
eukprot:1137281-Pelagomonas_calceolata.AAC.10